MICLSYTRPPDLSKKKNLFRLISANKQINTEIWNLSLSLTQRFKKFSISYFLWGILTKTLTTKNMGLRSNPRRTFFTLSLLSILVFLLFTSFALAQVSLSLSLSLYAYMWCLLVIVIVFVVNFRSSSLILTRKSLPDPKIWVAVARFVCVYFFFFFKGFVWLAAEKIWLERTRKKEKLLHVLCVSLIWVAFSFG